MSRGLFLWFAKAAEGGGTRDEVEGGTVDRYGRFAAVAVAVQKGSKWVVIKGNLSFFLT